MNQDGKTDVSSVRHWTAAWVWAEGEAKPYHFYLYARRTFDLEDQPSAGSLHISAADRYLLYVNGAYVGRGPARSDPRRKSYDTHDVAHLLRPGSNTIAVRAYTYGTPRGAHGWNSFSGNAYTVGERAGLWAQLDITLPNGDDLTVATDADWRVQPANAWDRGVDDINILVGATEVYDANADPVDWMAPEFDDTGWQPAWVIPPEDIEWFLMEAREIPLMREVESLPARIVTVGETIDLGRPGQVDIPELLNQETHFPLEHATADNVAAVLRGDSTAAELQGRFADEQGIRAPFIILDFGRQLFGFPRVRLRASEGTILDMTYGEQLIGGRIPAALRYGDRYIARAGEQTWELGEYKQFRYLHLTVRSTYAPVHIESVSVNEYQYPAEQRGRFECSDALLTNLWQACVDTTYLHMEDTIVCDAYRERVAWSTGDGSHGVHGVYVAYGGLPLSDRFLRFFPLSDRGDGMMQMAYPPDSPTIHFIPQFLLQWPSRVREHFLFTGRRAVVEELYDSVRRLVDWYEPYRDEEGLLRDLTAQNWLDWTPVDMRGANCATNMLYVKCLHDAVWLAEQLGREREANRWRAIEAEVRAAVRRVFWNAARGAFEDSFHRGALTGVASELANGLALLYDIASDAQARRIAAHLAKGGAELVEASPLYFCYVIDGLLARGFAREAVDLMRKRYRLMLESTESPTIWEGWGPFTGGNPISDDAGFAERDRARLLRPAGIRSLVHSGGVYVGYAISTQLLGVTPTAPGFARCRIRPRPGGLEWAKGVFPAPQGDIEVAWRQEQSGLAVETAIPDGITAELVLARDSETRQELLHNGAAVDLNEPGAGVRLEGASVLLTVQSGTHRIEMRGESQGT